MKKIIWIVVGIAVAVGAVLLIGRDRAQDAQKKAEGCVSCPGCAGSDGETASSSVEVELDPPSLESHTSAQSVEKLKLSDPVKALIGQDGKKHNYPSLLAAINELDYEISDTDLAALMQMLAWSDDRFPEGMRPIEINAVKNDVLDKLMRQKQLPEGLGSRIAEMAGNIENDPVWREYCVQFMGPFYERQSKVERSKVESLGAGNGGTTSVSSKDGTEPVPSNELQVIYAAMFQALDERGTEMAGTALIGLENLSRTHEEFDREIIAKKAVDIASDEMASTESRLTALRLAAGLTTKYTEGTKTEQDTEELTAKERIEHKTQVANAARVLAQTGETVLTRSAAIVTLGEVGGESDRELLESYSQADNRQIADAAKMALVKMDRRTN